MNQDLAISTHRLILHTVLGQEYHLLEADLTHEDLWLDRGFNDPLKYFQNNNNPIKYRIAQVIDNPNSAKYLLRVAVLKESQIIIASAGFHSLPDENGVIEIGFGVDPTYQNLGFGQEILHGMWGWVVNDPNVKTLRYSVSPKNLPSVHIVKKIGFNLIGQQIDDEDGPEDIYELSVANYKQIYLGKSS
ncbi:MAG: GNAT family N-acetyltransferase [Candidatus Nanopelagicus sp.]